jgi:hypothetical protein
MFVAVVILDEMRMRRIFIYGLIIFFRVISYTAQFSENKATELKMCVLIFCTVFIWKIYHSKKKWARSGQKFILVFM